MAGEIGVNTLADPHFDNGAGTWVPTDGALSTRGWDGGLGHDALGSCRNTAIAAIAAGDGLAIQSSSGAASGDEPAVVPGETWSTSAWVYHTSGATENFTMAITQRRSTGTTLVVSPATIAVPTATWVEVSQTITVTDPDIVSAYSIIRGFRQRAIAADAWYVIDDAFLGRVGPVQLATADGLQETYTEIQQWPERLSDRAAATLVVQSREAPVVVYDVFRTTTSTVTFLCRTADALAALLDLLRQPQKLTLTSPCPAVPNPAGDPFTFIPMRITLRRLTNSGSDFRTLVDVEIQEQ